MVDMRYIVELDRYAREPVQVFVARLRGNLPTSVIDK